MTAELFGNLGSFTEHLNTARIDSIRSTQATMHSIFHAGVVKKVGFL